MENTSLKFPTNISPYRSTSRQPWLFDQPLGNHGHCRAVIGNLIEELTASLVNGKRHKTMNGRYCPDVSRGQEYFECKAVGRSRQAFVYAGRLEKDRKFAQQYPLTYILWHHEAGIEEIPTVRALELAVRANLRAIYCIPFQQLYHQCVSRPLVKLNSKYGCAQDYPNTYGSGYRVPISALDPWQIAYYHTKPLIWPNRFLQVYADRLHGRDFRIPLWQELNQC